LNVGDLHRPSHFSLSAAYPQGLKLLGKHVHPEGSGAASFFLNEIPQGVKKKQGQSGRLLNPYPDGGKKEFHLPLKGVFCSKFGSCIFLA
jgi:hypothetical protein